MAYQNVGTPRFYVNDSHFMIANDVGNINVKGGTLEWDNGVAMLNMGKDYEMNLSNLRVDFPISNAYNFLFVLGHNLNSTNRRTYIVDYYGTIIPAVSTVNGEPNAIPVHDGWTLQIFEEQIADTARFYIWEGIATGITKIKSVCIGKYYDMPNAPDLSLTMSREYGGTKEFTTHNGSSMSNTMWSKAPKWGDLGAWEIGGGIPQLSKSGRRTWQLKFSYMDDSDLWGLNQLLHRARFDLVDGITDENDTLSNGTLGNFTYNLLTDENFFSQVWHKTLGGTLPFIFQPDSSNDNPDQFAICKFKDNSLKATQSAFNVYDISLSIEEVW